MLPEPPSRPVASRVAVGVSDGGPAVAAGGEIMAIRAAANHILLVLILSPVTAARVVIWSFIFLSFVFDFYFFVVVHLLPPLRFRMASPYLVSFISP